MSIPFSPSQIYAEQALLCRQPKGRTFFLQGVGPGRVEKLEPKDQNDERDWVQWVGFRDTRGNLHLIEVFKALTFQDADPSGRQPDFITLQAWDVLGTTYDLSKYTLNNWQDDHWFRIHGGRQWYDGIRYCQGRQQDKVMLHRVCNKTIREVTRIIDADTLVDCITNAEYNLFKNHGVKV